MADSAVPVWGNNTMKEEMAPPIEETTPVDEVAPPIEETTSVPDPRYAPTRKSWELMRESFRGEEPLAFIEDPQTRDFLRVLTDRSDNPEEERKKWALAAYFAQNVHADIRACHGNLDLFLKKFYNNEPVSIDYAYRDIGAALGVVNLILARKFRREAGRPRAAGDRPRWTSPAWRPAAATSTRR